MLMDFLRLHARARENIVFPLFSGFSFRGRLVMNRRIFCVNLRSSIQHPHVLYIPATLTLQLSYYY